MGDGLAIVNGLVASSFLDFLSFFAMILFPPFFGLPGVGGRCIICTLRATVSSEKIS